MARSGATTVSEYLAELPPERAAAVQPVLEVIRGNLPPGYEEGIGWGMITWAVPLATYPDTYNKQPLLLAALANQKNYVSLYLNSMYTIPPLRRVLDDSGRRLRMGKSCINYTRAEELPLDAVGEIIRRSDVASYVAAAKVARTAPRSS
jgi:hypothetical protein